MWCPPFPTVHPQWAQKQASKEESKAGALQVSVGRRKAGGPGETDRTGLGPLSSLEDTVEHE